VAERLEESYAGIYIVDMTDYSIIAYNRFDGDVSQIYDIAIVPDSRWPLIPSLQDEMLKDLFVY
jgi:hypothetical protein